jgi:hypothetical protein
MLPMVDCLFPIAFPLIQDVTYATNNNILSTLGGETVTITGTGFDSSITGIYYGLTGYEYTVAYFTISSTAIIYATTIAGYAATSDVMKWNLIGTTFPSSAVDGSV